MKTPPILFACTLMAGCIARTTDANEIGVKFCKLLCGSQRVEMVDPGRTVFMVPFLNDWYVLDISMQDFYMTHAVETGDRNERDDLVFKTREGNNISQDVILTWKLDHHQAEKIIAEVGPDIEHVKEKYVRPIARSIIRDYFSKLNSEEYYEGQRRFEEAKNATKELRERFASYGILVDQVNPKEYRFEDPQYQEAINTAKEAGQELAKYELEKDSQREYWKKELEKQKGTSSQVIAEADGQARSVQYQTDAAFEERKASAEATLKEKTAEAQAIRKLNQAMLSSGGDTAVKMEYAKHFNPTEIKILPCPSQGGGVTVNRLDLNALIAAEAQQASR